MGRALPFAAILAVSAVLLPAAIDAEAFTALVHLTRALRAEKEVASHLRQLVKAEEERLRHVLRLAEEYDEHADEALVDPERFLANPVNAFTFVKKFTSDMDELQGLVLSQESGKAFVEELKRLQPDLPDKEDMDGSAAALLRLQDTYELPTHRIADGTFLRPEVLLGRSKPMTARDCFQLGSFAFDRKDWYHTLLWMLEAFDTQQFEINKTISKTVVLDYLSYAAAMQGNTRHALHWTEEWLTIQPTHERALANKRYYEDAIRKEDEEMLAQGLPAPPRGVLPALKNKRPVDEYRRSQEFQNYEALCRNEDVFPNPNQDRLKCFLLTKNHPLLIYAPAKVEMLYRKPNLYLYHDVVNDYEISVIKLLATPRLARATVNDPATGKLVHASYRVSKSGWIRDEENAVIRTISRRISAMTGLSLETVEQLQVVNYGIGGQYEPHFDFSRVHHDTHQFEEEIGNRIATWIFYLSDVDAGGATVFTSIGAKIWPKKGTAAFWFNLYRNGEGDMETRHAACPVLAGSKWVANKWFHERGQEFLRPCGLSEDA